MPDTISINIPSDALAGIEACQSSGDVYDMNEYSAVLNWLKKNQQSSAYDWVANNASKYIEGINNSFLASD